MEYMENGDLGAFMKTHETTEQQGRTVARQVLEGLNIMHKNNFCHRDVKPEVVFLHRPRLCSMLTLNVEHPCCLSTAGGSPG